MWWTKDLRLKPVMGQISSISSVSVPYYSLTSMSSNLSSILLASFQATSPLPGLVGVPTTRRMRMRESRAVDPL